MIVQDVVIKHGQIFVIADDKDGKRYLSPFKSVLRVIYDNDNLLRVKLDIQSKEMKGLHKIIDEFASELDKVCIDCYKHISKSKEKKT